MENNFGHRIRAARTSLGISQGTLADRAGTSQAAIHLIETGARSPSLAVAARIANALGLAIDDLSTEREPAMSPLEAKALYLFKMLSKREKDAVLALMNELTNEKPGD